MSYFFKPGSILVVAEHFQGEVRPVTHELVRFAEALQNFRPAEIHILVLGEKVEDLVKYLAVTSGKDVLGLSAPELAQYNGEAYKSALHEVLAEQLPAYICVAHSSRGADFAPGLAMRLNAACITGVSSITSQEDEVCFSRDIFGGKINADMLSSAKTTVLTLQPGSYGATPKKDPAQTSGKVFIKSIAVTSPSSRTLSTTACQTSDLDLSTAKVVVSAGRGIGDEENLQLIRDLASMIPQSVVCGSRPVIDLGWMSYDRQVGVTGATVTPDLYLACGISGAAQHASGMNGSGFIVSINTDPMAAIFNFSDICIVENLMTFIPLLLEKMAEQTTGKVSPG